MTLRKEKELSKDKSNMSQDKATQEIIELGAIAVLLYGGDAEEGLRRFIEEDIPDEVVPVVEQHKQYITQEIRKKLGMPTPKAAQSL